VPTPPSPAKTGGVAFLLTQLGAQAADRFADALGELDLTPPLVGVLRVLRFDPGLTQQALAQRLGMVPSRMVALVDDLEGRGWIERTRDPADRRANALTVTPAGERAFSSIAAVAQAHEKRMTQGLTEAERTALAELLGKLASARGLAPGVHPGYRRS
jgi:DNA-binding MarR family transcriptional regulator